MMRLSFTLIALLIMTISSSAHASTINDKDAQRLKSIFENMLQKHKEKAANNGATLSTSDNITIEQAADYYAVTMPAMTMTDKKQHQTEIGMIAVNVKPTEDSESWTMSIALPMPIIKKDEEGKLINELNIGQQRMTGLWHEKLENFTKVDAQYNNIVFKDLKRGTTSTLDNIVIESDITVNDEKLSGPTEIILNGLSSTNKKGETAITIGQVSFDMQYQDISLSMINAQNLIPLAKNIGGMNFKATMQNLKGVYNLDKLTLDYNAPKPVNNKASQYVRLSYNGLEATKENMIYADFIPQKSEINLQLKDLPLDSILNIVKSQFEKADKPSAAQQLIMMQMITNLPKKLADAGTVFDINSFDFKNKTYDFQTEGEIKASKDSPFGMIGNVILKMKGLDETQEMIDDKMKDASSKDKAILERLKSHLASLKTIMKKGIAGYESDIELTKEGNITLNGKDMGNAIGAVGAIK